MKTKFILCIVLISAQISFAQETRLWLSIGAGLDNTSNEKMHSTGNGFNVQADAFVPFYRKGWDGTVKGGFALGVHIAGNYTGIRNPRPDNADVASRYQVYGGKVAVTDQSEGKISGSFSGLAGIGARMDWGKFNLSPSVNLGYLHFKQKGYVQTGSLDMNGQTQQKDLVKSERQSTNGLVYKPQLKIGYDFARNFSFFVSPSMVLGPKIKHTTSYLVPQGGFNDKNTYEASQLAKGTWESSTGAGRYRIMELNAGITMSIGKRQSTVKQSQGMNFGEKVAGGLQSGANAKTVTDSSKGGNTKPGGAVSSSYAAGKAVSSNGGSGTPQNMPATDFNTTRSNRDNRLSTNTDSDSSMPKRLSMTPTTTRQTQGMNFGEKVTQGVAANQGENPLYEGNASSGVNPMYDPNKLAIPGSPIGGIVVKGGKNPGGNNIIAVSNSNGEVLLNNLEAGNYLFRISTPEQPAEKSINEKGVKRSESAAMARPGQPIGGIIVKGGKNPGGSFLRLTVDNDGQIGFEVLEAGNYKLIIATPEVNQPAPESTNKSKGNIKERPASGLKDTLKTNV
ncbi:MAG: hypothetical protein KF746_25450 [Chitinophagaceae bacterium]|nr:hypothetical protein [Chitinophagaceae bacterium]